MPRDVGSFDADLRVFASGGERPPVGAALRAKRQTEGLTLEAVAQRTRVRRAYLQAIEESDWDSLPPGPYACGYVRLYAEALGLNGSKAMEELKEERPAERPVLPSPVGLAHQDRRRVSPLAIGAAGLIAVAFVGWNIVQRASPVPEEHVAPPVEAAWLTAQTGGVVRVGAPTPPPPDQNAPAPYETPGLAAAMAARQPNGAALIPAVAATPSSSAPQAPVGAAFNPRAAIHGALPQESRLTVQAREPASIVVRRRDGSILFARQLAAGEAYRAPLEPGLVLDVSQPTAFDVYRDGEFRGQLREPQSRADGWLG